MSAAVVKSDWIVEPPSVEVGQPVTLRLVVEHAAGLVFDREGLVGAFESGLDAAWAVLDRADAVTRPGESGRAATTFEWTVVSLEPGARDVPGLTFALGGETLEVSATEVSVEGVLAETALSHRPGLGFREVAEGPGDAFPGLAIGLVLAAVVIASLVLRRRRRRDDAPAELAPAERLRSRLETWRADVPRDARGIRDLHFELSELLRAGVDQSLGEPRRGLSDDEWLAELERRDALSQSLRAELAQLLAAAGGVKYGGEEPSPWAVEERLAAAERVRAGLPEGRA